MVYKPYKGDILLESHLSVLLKNSTFSGFGFRAVQVGLQKIPVVFTPIQKTPSKLASLLKEAL